MAFVPPGRGNEARERTGCTGHGFLRVHSESESGVSWKWWPQKSTEWVTGSRVGVLTDLSLLGSGEPCGPDGNDYLWVRTGAGTWPR